MITIGLTGSIGTGKSAALDYIASKHIPVFDADRVVHDLYDSRELVQFVGEHFPEAVVHKSMHKKVDRKILGAVMQRDPAQLKTLEDKLHPLVRRQAADFIAHHQARGETLCVLDIPLLFEGGRDNEFDCVVVVATSAALQKMRVLARVNMNQARLDEFLLRQMKQDEKIRRADHVIWNNGTLNDFHRRIDETIGQIVMKGVAKAAKKD